MNNFGGGSMTKKNWGELTPVGMKQHQKLGKIWRKIYIQELLFLSPQYKRSQIQTYSSKYNRTMLSLASQLYGLYPSGTGPIFPELKNKSLYRPPYSNITVPFKYISALPFGYQPIKILQNQKLMMVECSGWGPRQQQNIRNNWQAQQQIKLKYRQFYMRMGKMFQFNPQNAALRTMFEVYDVVNVNKHLGLALPEGFTSDDEKNIKHFANYLFYLAAHGDNGRLQITGKLLKIFQTFDKRVQNPQGYPLKWTFMSGHDGDIVSMHLALNISSHNCIQQLYRTGKSSSTNCQDGAVQFASNLIFQLHSADAINFYVMIRSNGKYIQFCSNKSYKCEYQKFKELMNSSIVQDQGPPCGQKIDSAMNKAFKAKYKKL